MKLRKGKPLLASALLAVAAATATFAAAGTLQAVDVKQGAVLQSRGALLLDVRESDEYAEGHAPGSTLIPLGQLQHRLQEIDGYQNKPIVLICRSGRRSEQALKLLERAGFSAAVLRGCILATGGEIILNGRETLATFEIFEPGTQAWSPAPPLRHPIHGVAAAVVGDRFYLLGGSSRAGAIENEGRLMIYNP